MSTEDTPKPVASHAGRADLPALPVPIVKGDYTAGDMLAYARAAVAAAVAKERERCAALCENVVYEYLEGSPERMAAERALSVVRGA